jgi:hypothetical protein
MHRLQTRNVNAHWEVLVPFSTGEQWIQCDSMQEARHMSVAGDLAFETIEGRRTGEEAAQELEDAARLFFKYECHERAIWLAEHAKVARGEPSIFDTVRDDPQT